MNTTHPIDIAAGTTVLNAKGEILLVRRKATARVSPGEWTRPLGSVEFGEKGWRAAKREVWEETGARIKLASKKPYHVAEFIHPREKPPRHAILMEYRGTFVSGKVRNKEPNKHDDVQWFALDKLPKKLSRNTRKAIKLLELQKK